MNVQNVNNLIEELIEISDTKYGLLKVGQDTILKDITFIEKYEALKLELNNNTFDDIDMTQFPKMKILKEWIEKINAIEQQKLNRNVRMNKASNAYKNRMER
jgi:hypothetical protein